MNFLFIVATQEIRHRPVFDSFVIRLNIRSSGGFAMRITCREDKRVTKERIIITTGTMLI